MNVTKLEKLAPEIIIALERGRDVMTYADELDLARQLRAAMSEQPTCPLCGDNHRTGNGYVCTHAECPADQPEGKVVPVERELLEKICEGVRHAVTSGVLDSRSMAADASLILEARLAAAPASETNFEVAHGSRVPCRYCGKYVYPENECWNVGMSKKCGNHVATETASEPNAAATQTEGDLMESSTTNPTEHPASAAAPAFYGEPLPVSASPATPSKLPLSADQIECWLRISKNIESWTCSTPDPESAPVVLIEPDELEKLANQALAAIELEQDVLAKGAMAEGVRERCEMLEQRVADLEAVEKIRDEELAAVKEKHGNALIRAEKAERELAELKARIK